MLLSNLGTYMEKINLLKKCLLSFLLSFMLISFSGCLELKQTGKEGASNIQGNGAGYGGENGAGYGGGDNALTNARTLLVRALIQFKDGVSQGDIANADACQTQVRAPALCNLLVGLAPPQKTFIIDFLKAHVQSLLNMNLGSNKVRFEFTQEFLGFSQSNGFSRDLAAKTKLGREGNILFNTDAVQVMSDWERLQLIAHELGHKLEKISTNQMYIDDDSVIGPFSSGKVFLDTLGSALAGYLASGIGKTIVAFPTDKTCDSNTTGQLLASAPYYANKSQEAIGLLPRIQTTKDSGADFTLTAWVRIFDDLQSSDFNYLGQVIFSNKDFQYGILPGLQLFRLKNGNFGAYGGTGRIIDSGVKLTSGGYHLVALKRTQNKFFLSVDDIPGNSDVATYFSSYEAKNILAGLIEVGRSASAKAMLGAPGNNPTPPTGTGVIRSNGYDFHRFDFWKGNIASFSFYGSALTDDEIKTLAQCAPQAYRVSTPTNVGPGYPIPSTETDGQINTMILNNKILYVGGEFENFGDQPRYHLAALDTEKNNAVTSWAPVIYGGPVRALAISGTTLYVGGNFLRVNGFERNNLAAINLTTGSLLDWKPDPDGEITSLAVSNNQLFVGGKFKKIQNSNTSYLASFNISDANNILLRADWNVRPNGVVTTLLVSDNLLYFGGYFSKIGVDYREQLAAADVTNGRLAPWNPGAFWGDVLSMAASGNTLYVGGDFQYLGNPKVKRVTLGAIHKDTGEVLDFNPSPDYYGVYSVTATMNGLLIGGNFERIGSTTRKYVAELNTDGILSEWNPNPDGPVFSMVPLGNKIYLGGDFKNLNNQKALYFGVMAK